MLCLVLRMSLLHHYQIILRRIYDNNKISKSNTKKEMKEFQGEKKHSGKYILLLMVKLAFKPMVQQ